MNTPSSQRVYTDPAQVDGFSILIPSWNNLDYLKLCIEGLKKNSGLHHQIIVAINEGVDGTIRYVENNEIDHVIFKKNVGVCYAVNAARTLALSHYVVYLNDDMYPLPNWDTILYQKINHLSSKLFMLSATMIEPVDTRNPCVIVQDFGRDFKSFNERGVIEFAKNCNVNDWRGASWPPFVVHRDVWDLVGGFGIEFTPGFYSDPDFSMKLYHLGVRNFIGLGASLVYHFGTKSTKRVQKNRGKDVFLLKWGISASDFYKYTLRLGEEFESTTQHDFRIKSLMLKTKYYFKSLLALIRR